MSHSVCKSFWVTMCADLVGPGARGCVYICWFSKCGECPAPWVFTGDFWFRCRTLNPFLLPPSCPSLQRDGSPPLLILSGYHSDEGEKSPGCRFRFEFSCCRNLVGAEHGQGRVDHTEGWVSTVRYLKNYQWGKTRLDLKKSSLVSHPAAQEAEEREKWMRGRKRMDCFAFSLWTKGWRCVTNVALFKFECCIFGFELKSQMALGRCSALGMFFFFKKVAFFADGLMHRYNANVLQ